jgi:hypothetical protein
MEIQENSNKFLLSQNTVYTNPQSGYQIDKQVQNNIT